MDQRLQKPLGINLCVIGVGLIGCKKYKLKLHYCSDTRDAVEELQLAIHIIRHLY